MGTTHASNAGRTGRGIRRARAGLAGGSLVVGLVAGGLGAAAPAGATAHLAHARVSPHNAVPHATDLFGSSWRAKVPQGSFGLGHAGASASSPASSSPALLPQAPNLGPSVFTLTVDTGTDTDPATPGAACAPGNAGSCSLRAAVEAGDIQGVAHPGTGPVTVDVPGGTYTLSLGELVVTDPAGLEITGTGAGPSSVVITQGGSATAKSRVLMEAECSDATLPVTPNFNPSCTGPAAGLGPDLVLSDVTVEGGNADTDPFQTEYGGGLLQEEPSDLMQLDDVVVTGNEARYGGGVASDASLWINDSSVTDNTASYQDHGTGAGGGLLFTDADVRMTDTTVLDNVVGVTAATTTFEGGTIVGGGIATRNATLAITGGAVSDNQAVTGDFDTSEGGGLYLRGSTTIDATAVTGNSATGSASPTTPYGALGGGIYVGYGLEALTGANVSGNAATASLFAAGGGIAFDSSSPVITSSTIDANSVDVTGVTATTTGPYLVGDVASGGGIVVVTEGLTVTARTTSISSNTAGGISGADGGAFSSEGPFGALESGAGLALTNVAMDGNSVSGSATGTGGDGGAVYLEDSHGALSVSSSSISGNQAIDGNGGAFYANPDSFTLTDDVVDDNSATGTGTTNDVGWGGAFTIWAGTIVGTTISGNRATSGGGAISETTLQLSSSTISHNAGRWGGGIDDFGGLQSTASAIVDNTTTGTTNTGGGIDVADRARLSLVDTTVADNQSTTGAGIYETGGDGTYQVGPTTYPEPGGVGGPLSGSTIAGNHTSAGTEQDCAFGSGYTGGAPGAPFTSAGGNVVGDTSCNLTAPSDRQGPTAQGYTLAGDTGGVYNFKTPFLGSLPGDNVHITDVGGAADVPGGAGYWMFGKDGGVFSLGDAPFYGSVPGAGVHVDNVVAMAPTPTGGGYWLVGATGGVYAFGNAPFYGSVPGVGVSVDNIVGMAATPDGRGYLLVGATGGVYAFGDADFAGSLPGDNVHVDNVVGMTSTATGEGYFMVGATGGVYAFGTARFVPNGSVPGAGVHVTDITSIDAMPTGKGYWVFGDTGGVYAFGDAPFHGSLPGVGVHVTNVVGGFAI